jgi:mannose-6-phosphate isomerase-like protein (cupin superfamily)
MQVISSQTAEHYPWGDQCDGWHLLRSPEVSVIQERMPSNSSEVPHLHTKSRQFFYVLSGRLSVLVNGTTFIVEAERGLEIPPGTPHQVFNDSDSDAGFIVISVPPSHEDKILTA